MATAVLALIDCSRQGGRAPTEIGDQVRFRAGKVFFWPEEGSHSAIPQDAEMEGKVIGFSDSGSEPRVFALVEVLKAQTVVVPVSELEVTKPGT
jgi:hypothetical protein